MKRESIILLMVVTVEVRWALPEGQPYSVSSRFAGPIIATFSHDRLCVRTEKLTLPDGAEVEIVQVSTVLVTSALAQTVWVVPLDTPRGEPRPDGGDRPGL